MVPKVGWSGGIQDFLTILTEHPNLERVGYKTGQLDRPLMDFQNLNFRTRNDLLRSKFLKENTEKPHQKMIR